VTAKGHLKTRDSINTFRLHLLWAAIAALLLIVSFRFHHDYTTLRVWGMLAVITGLGPPLIVMASRLRQGDSSVAGPRSASVPYDSAWVPYDVRIPRQARPAFPVQPRFPDEARLTDGAAAHGHQAHGTAVHSLPARPWNAW